MNLNGGDIEAVIRIPGRETEEIAETRDRGDRDIEAAKISSLSRSRRSHSTRYERRFERREKRKEPERSCSGRRSDHDAAESERFWQPCASGLLGEA